jgi:hypothetical protein
MRKGMTAMVAGLALLAGTVAARSRPRAAPPDRLSAAISQDFADAAMRAQLEPSYRKRGLGFDFQDRRPNRHFHSWMVIPTWGQGVHYFSVDRRTGDVWADASCELVRSPKLASLQAKFRRRFRVTASQVQQLERQGFPGPAC